MEDIIIATKNPGKVKEFSDFFRDYHIRILSLLDFPAIADVEETGETFEENAALKAEQIASNFDKLVLADDSGLMIDALEGKPGIYSARYAGEPTDDQANINKVLKELKNVPEEKRTARFICVLALARPNVETIFHVGYCEGKIAETEKGTHGFGYDPIFIPENSEKHMAELTPQEKSQLSHRSQALAKLANWIDNNTTSMVEGAIDDA